MITRTKDNFSATTLLRYAFYLMVFLAFFLAINFWYVGVRELLVKWFSAIRYESAPWMGDYLFSGLLMFTALCCWADYKIIKTAKLKEYNMIVLLALDALCLLLAMVIMIVYNNLFKNPGQVASAESLSYIPVILVLVFAKNWVFARVLRARAFRPGGL
jgi:hypothetical protein